MFYAKHCSQQHPTRAMSVLFQRQKGQNFVYLKSKKPPKKSSTIFCSRIGLETRHDAKSRESRFYSCPKRIRSFVFGRQPNQKKSPRIQQPSQGR